MKHQSIRAILIILLIIIGVSMSLLLVFFFFGGPDISDEICKGDVTVYRELLNAHTTRAKDLAQITFLALVPVFSTLAGSYIRGKEEE